MVKMSRVECESCLQTFTRGSALKVHREKCQLLENNDPGEEPSVKVSEEKSALLNNNASENLINNAFKAIEKTESLDVITSDVDGAHKKEVGKNCVLEKANPGNFPISDKEEEMQITGDVICCTDTDSVDTQEDKNISKLPPHTDRSKTEFLKKLKIEENFQLAQQKPQSSKSANLKSTSSFCVLNNQNMKDNFSCFNCDLKFQNLRIFLKHSFDHSIVQPYTCKCCEKKFELYSVYRRHQEKCIKEFIGHVVRKVSTSNYHRKNKILTKGLIIKHRKSKNLSGKFTGNNKSAILHQVVQIKNKYRKFWNSCKSNLVEKNDQSNDGYLSDENFAGKKYKCKLCPKTFSRRNTLNRHEMIHSGEKPFVCDYCSRAFNRKYACDGHMQKIHLKPKNSTSQTK